MKNKSKVNFKTGLIAIAVMLAIVFIVKFSLKSDKHFRITHNTEVLQTPTPNGGYVAGSPESYTIEASGAVAAKLVEKNNAIWVYIGFALLALAVIWIVVVTNDIITIGENSTAGNNVMGVLVGLALPCFIAAYSSAYVSNAKTITPQEYNAIKDSPDEIANLFLGKDYIR
jgi:hypothetical protein